MKLLFGIGTQNETVKWTISLFARGHRFKASSTISRQPPGCANCGVYRGCRKWNLRGHGPLATDGVKKLSSLPNNLRFRCDRGSLFGRRTTILGLTWDQKGKHLTWDGFGATRLPESDLTL